MKKNVNELKVFLFKKIIYIILITIILIISGIGYSLNNINYVATKKILIDNLEETNMIETYIEMLSGSEILSNAIENTSFSLEKVENSIKVDSIEKTNMIQIKLCGENAEETQNICNEILNIFTIKINQIYGETQIHIIDDSGKYICKQNVYFVAILTGICGIILSILFFIICFLFDNKIKSCKDIEDITQIKSLISIPEIKDIRKKKLSLKNIRLHKSEVFKTLMTNIQFVSINNNQSKSIVITSPNSREGKTYVAINLAIEYAKAGQKVILIDADMRKGKIAKIFNLPNQLGVSNYLANLDSNGNYITEMITRFINDTEIKNLNVITAGNTPPNPVELLNEGKLKELIKELKIFYDIIIFDTVSVLEASEVDILSKMSDLTLMLSSYGHTQINECKSAYDRLEKIEENSVGMGLNKIPDRKIKKKIAIFKFNMNIKTDKFKNRFKKFFIVFSKVLNKIFRLKSILKKIFRIILKSLKFVRNMLIKVIHIILKNTQNFKEYIKHNKIKKDEIKLISSGEKLNFNNVIKDVYEERILNAQENVLNKENLDFIDKKIEFKEVIDNTSQNFVDKKNENKVKSKLDLMLEQEKNKEGSVLEVNEKDDKIEIISSDLTIEETKDEIVEIDMTQMKKINETLKEKTMNEEKNEEINIQEEIEYQDIDFQNAEVITEEMIRRQVEMDDFVRMAEQDDEDEKLKIKHKKMQEKLDGQIRRKEKMNVFVENNIEKINSFIKNISELYGEKNEERLKIKRQKEIKRNEEREIALRRKEARKAYRERARQMHREEARIKEELQEDNLYPKPKM